MKAAGLKIDSEALESATAYAQSLGQAAVVTKQGDRYIINPLTDDPKFPKGYFSFKREGLEDSGNPALELAKLRNLTPGLTAIITQDGYQIREKEFERRHINGPSTATTLATFRTESLYRNGDRHFQGQREAFGPGLSNIKDKDQFLRQYHRSLRETALSVLDTSATEARIKQEKFAQGMPASEAPKIHKVATKLEVVFQIC